jgi:hypothetical protein
MTVWTLKNVILKLDTFKTFLVTHGAQVLEPTNEWEVVRFKNANETSIIYCTKRGGLTFTGNALDAWNAFKSNTAWRAIPATKRQQKSTPDIATIRARDGDECFYCLTYVAVHEESIEHLVELTSGGPNHISNKFLAHVKCNQAVGNLSAPEKIALHVAVKIRRLK